MPIYAYRCEHCGFQKDVLQKMSDPLLVDCPSCGQPTFRKQVTAAGFQLKGSGWYVTDFRNPATKEPTKKATDEAGGATKSDGATEAKPADTTAPATAPAPAPAPAPTSKTEAAPAKPSSGGDAA